MTNRQWLIWQLIDMSDEQFAFAVNGVKCTEMLEGGLCHTGCGFKCDEGHKAWLNQEHVESGENND
jgi:hypothetical protein